MRATETLSDPNDQLHPPISATATANVSGRRQRRGAWLAIVLLLFVGITVWHQQILTSIGGVLIKETSEPSPTALLVVSGDDRFDWVEKLHFQGASTVLLYHPRPDRLERMGILPARDESTRKQLLRRGFPPEHLTYVSEQPLRQEDLVAAVGEWLEKNPQETVGVVCDRFSSRCWHFKFSRLDGEQFKGRIQIVGVPPRRSGETDWWKSKPGLLAVLNGSLSLGFEVVSGGNRPAWQERNHVDFVAAFTGPSAP